MTGLTNVEDENDRARLLLENMRADTWLANALSAYVGDMDTDRCTRHLALLRRLAGDVESALVHEGSCSALRKMDTYLQMRRQARDPCPAQSLSEVRDMLADADKGLDGTVARYREMAVWSTMEPGAAAAFNASWSNAISAASLVRTVVFCAHHYEFNRGLPGWMPMQAYAMWRSWTLRACENQNDALRAVIRRAEELLEQLEAEERKATGDEP